MCGNAVYHPLKNFQDSRGVLARTGGPAKTLEERSVHPPKKLEEGSRQQVLLLKKQSPSRVGRQLCGDSGLQGLVSFSIGAGRLDSHPHSAFCGTFLNKYIYNLVLGGWFTPGCYV